MATTAEFLRNIAVAAVLFLISSLGRADQLQWSRVPKDAQQSLEDVRLCLARESVVPGALERRCGAFLVLSQKRFDEVQACMAPARLVDYQEYLYEGTRNQDGRAIALYRCNDWTLDVTFDLHGRAFEAHWIGEVLS